MSDGLSDYWAMRLRDGREREWVENLSASDWDKPIVPRRDAPRGWYRADKGKNDTTEPVLPMPRKKWAYWSVGPHKVRLPGFNLDWAGWGGMTVGEAETLRDDLTRAINQSRTEPPPYFWLGVEAEAA